MTPYFTHYDITLYHDDCLSLMPLLGQTFDMVLADPPYGTTRNHWDRELPNKLLWASYDLVTTARTPVVLFASGSFGARLIVDNLSRYRYTLIWEKQSVTGFLNAKRQPLRSHEDIVVFYAKQPVYNPQMVMTGKKSHSRGKRVDRTVNHYGAFNNTEVPAEQQGQYPRSVLSYPRPKEGLHPNQKPLDLCRWLIRTYTNPGDIVLDNTAGSCTTLLAAALEGRRAVGIETHEEYCETAASRLQKELA
jgi:DNA modification methylase